jgi:hypothetical protein
METPFGLEREKIRATLDKKPLVRAIALAIETLQGTIETGMEDFSVNVDLTVNIQREKALDKNVRVNVYVPRFWDDSRPSYGGKAVVPSPENRISISAELDQKTLAWSMAWVIQTLLTAVRAEQEDFWVKIDLNVHIMNGRANEKRATINVYGDLIDPYATTIVETLSLGVISEEFLRSRSAKILKKRMEINRLDEQGTGDSLVSYLNRCA